MTHGLRLSFQRSLTPRLTTSPSPSVLTSKAASTRILPFIPNWLEKGYVREILVPVPLYFSRMFTVPKQDGGVRPVIDLSELNKLLIVPKFKMETVASISKALLTPGWGTTTDLEDAYLKVPVALSFQRYLAFTVYDPAVKRYRIFLFQVMPFGLSSAPWAFTRIIKPVKKLLHTQGIHLHTYLDDFLNVAPSSLLADQQISYIYQLLQSLGFSINHKKSDRVPRQTIEYLGVSWDLQALTLSLTPQKRNYIRLKCQQTIWSSHRSRRQLESLVGFLNFSAPFLRLGRLQLIPIIHWMNRWTSPASRDLPVPLNQALRKSLSLWLKDDFLLSQVPIHIPAPSLEVMADASLYGWCGVLLPDQIREEWPVGLHQESMNWKELQAILLTVVHFAPQLEGRTATVWTDSWTAVACIRRQGSLHSVKLWYLTKELLDFCHLHRITLVPSHLQGVLNVIADKGSRSGPISTEWALDPDSFQEICSVIGTPQLDLFATRHNTQLYDFISPCPDPAALHRDAFSLDWNDWESIYLFPPLQCLQQVVSLLRIYKGKGFLIAPYWPSAPWFVTLKRRCPLRRPLRLGHYLFQYTSQGLILHPRISGLKLTAWML